jgi:hypothetical protein
MKNKLIILSAGILFFTLSCREDDPVKIVHSNTTRIDYSINNPLEMPCIEFTLSNLYDLSEHSVCALTVIANENSESLSLIIMIEDNAGNKTDVEPFSITTSEIPKDNQAHTYTIDFSDRLESSTNITSGVNIERISKVRLYINAGIQGSVSEGYFWLDKIEFKKLQ